MTPEPWDLIRGLDARERAVLVAIYEHKVLLTEHLASHQDITLSAKAVPRSWHRSLGSRARSSAMW